jgi:hypothetical protein
MFLSTLSGTRVALRQRSNSLYIPNSIPDHEFDALPKNIKMLIFTIASMCRGVVIIVTSIKTSYTGRKRTAMNGPSHLRNKAVDIIFAVKDKDGNNDRFRNFFSGNMTYNWHLAKLLDPIGKKYHVTVGFESDHLHLEPAGRFLSGKGGVVRKTQLMPFYRKFFKIRTLDTEDPVRYRDVHFNPTTFIPVDSIV